MERPGGRFQNISCRVGCRSSRRDGERRQVGIVDCGSDQLAATITTPVMNVDSNLDVREIEHDQKHALVSSRQRRCRPVALRNWSPYMRPVWSSPRSMTSPAGECSRWSQPRPRCGRCYWNVGLRPPGCVPVRPNRGGDDGRTTRAVGNKDPVRLAGKWRPWWGISHGRPEPMAAGICDANDV